MFASVRTKFVVIARVLVFAFSVCPLISILLKEDDKLKVIRKNAITQNIADVDAQRDIILEA